MQPAEATLEQCVAADVAFHQAIARASQNAVLTWMAAAIHSLLSGAIRLTMQEGFHPGRVYRRHAPILEAIEARDAEAAARAMAEHLRFTEERLRQAGETAAAPAA
jgi:GntR family transcriptional repressor for pyruvate dehydrogenase complex